MSSNRTDASDPLAIDAPAEIERVATRMRAQLKAPLRRRGFVVGLSGGIDSSVCAALAVRAVGAGRVLGLLMPERESSPESVVLAEAVARSLGIRSVHEDITSVLEALGCYRRRDEAIRAVVPDHADGRRSRLVQAPGPDRRYQVFHIDVETADGARQRTRLSAEACRGVVAATSFKQRVRAMVAYYHADLLGYAVVGTPNRLEFDQGFFVKQGDAAADLKPLAHLYKSQVYQLADALDVPEGVRRRTPTTDTYSLPQSQAEFYFPYSHRVMDLCLFGSLHEVPPEVLAPQVGLSPAEVEMVYRELLSRREASRYLHEGALLADETS